MRWIKQGLIAFAVAVSILLIAYFVVFKTELIFSRAGVPEKITRVEWVKDSSKAEARSIFETKLKKKEATQKKARIGAKNNGGDEDYIVIEDEEEIAVEETPDNGQLTNMETTGERSSKNSYQVISVAYFYNTPNEQTRTKDSISYWNRSYASLKPIEEKNGFVFVQFNDPSGQTSKGWLRKKDLKKVNTIFESNKE